MIDAPKVPSVNKLPHDMGGDVTGPISKSDAGMKFWHKQVNALRNLMTGNGHTTTDELRRCTEGLGETYNQIGYFERSTTALRNLSIEKGYITEEELVEKMAEVRARFDVPDEMDPATKKNEPQ
jgi:hypothetical protein